MRTRLSTEQRREQLLAVGAKLFAEQPYDDVWIEKVAEVAGVSRGLLYHYFPTKREFFAEIMRAEHQRMLERTAAEPTLPLVEQLKQGLLAYVQHARRHPDAYRVVHRAARGGSSPELHAISAEFDHRQQERICAGLAELITVTDATRLGVAAWLDFVDAMVLRWLDDPAISETELCETGVRTLIATIGANPADFAEDET